MMYRVKIKPHIRREIDGAWCCFTHTDVVFNGDTPAAAYEFWKKWDSLNKLCGLYDHVTTDGKIVLRCIGEPSNINQTDRQT